MYLILYIFTILTVLSACSTSPLKNCENESKVKPQICSMSMIEKKCTCKDL